MRTSSLTHVLAAACLLAGSSSVFAVDVGGIAIHGSLSATASATDREGYTFYGDNDGKLSINSVELIVNGTYRFENGLRTGAQFYGYKLHDSSDLTLDWANVDYQFQQWLGVRAGRNKLPLGLYNDAQDLDQVRVFASLPLAFYPRYLRPITASYDGIGVYGNVGLGGAGSLDYQVFAGRTDDVPHDTVFLTNFSSFIHWDSWDIQGVIYGAWLLWNTPLEGLRAGASFSYYPKNEIHGYLEYSSNLAGSDLAFTSRFGPGVWDAAFAGKPADIFDVEVLFTAYSLEYTFGDWVAAAEVKFVDIDGRNSIPALGNVSASVQELNRLTFAYVSLTYQATDRLGLGAYWGYRDDDYTSEAATNEWRQVAHDWCVAASYAVTDYWLVKGEYHWNDGISLLYDTTRGNPLSERYWQYFVLKTTFSF